jgi:hypothetical protein
MNFSMAPSGPLIDRQLAVLSEVPLPLLIALVSLQHVNINCLCLPKIYIIFRIPGFLSQILIFILPVSRISDTGSNNNSSKRGEGKICCPTFFSSHKYVNM